MMLWSFSSTSSEDHESLSEFWLISRPEVATPPALDAFPGAYKIFAARNLFTASMFDGMFAPSATSLQPLSRSFCASSPRSSFCVAQGNAQSHFTSQTFLPSKYFADGNCFAYSEMRPRRTVLSSFTQLSFSCVIPSAS